MSLRPSLVVFLIAAACFVWQFAVAPWSASAARWLPGGAAGMVGVLLIGLALVIFWMESAGYRERSSPALRKARRAAIEESHVRTGPLAEEDSPEPH